MHFLVRVFNLVTSLTLPNTGSRGLVLLGEKFYILLVRETEGKRNFIQKIGGRFSGTHFFIVLKEVTRKETNFTEI